MKKLFTLIAVLVIGCEVYSQEIGVRFGEFGSSNVAIDAILNLKGEKRIHADVSFGNHGVGVNAILDVVNRRFNNFDNFSWYAGFGAGVFIGDPFQLSIPGEVGLEYHFARTPIALGLDWRPTLNIVDDTSFTVDTVGFNARFCF